MARERPAIRDGNHPLASELPRPADNPKPQPTQTLPETERQQPAATRTCAVTGPRTFVIEVPRSFRTVIHWDGGLDPQSPRLARQRNGAVAGCAFRAGGVTVGARRLPSKGMQVFPEMPKVRAAATADPGFFVSGPELSPTVHARNRTGMSAPDVMVALCTDRETF